MTQTVAETYFPDAIVTSDDSPVLLTRLLGTTAHTGVGVPAVRIIGINGSELDRDGFLSLPGIRVGAGDGSGYVIQRAIDGQLAFVPDAGYAGITTFTYTIADHTGDQATVVATLNVLTEEPDRITFVDGSHSVSVSEGMDSAILGALAFDGFSAHDYKHVQVFEGDDTMPSHRFVMSGDKLRVLQPLDSKNEGTIHLKILAQDESGVTLTDDIAIDVRPSGLAARVYDLDQFHFALDGLEQLNTVLPDDATQVFANSVLDHTPEIDGADLGNAHAFGLHLVVDNDATVPAHLPDHFDV